MEIDINNLTDFKVKNSFFKEIVKDIFKKEGKENCSASIALVDRKTIREINKKYRKKDKATDVLSFAYSESNCFCNDRILGEIIICPYEIENEKKALTKVLIHGTLHLLGYDHEKGKKEEKKMKEKENEYLSLF
jgi:probable rRNA maturation factor